MPDTAMQEQQSEKKQAPDTGKSLEKLLMKEKNYLSAVVYLGDEKEYVKPFLSVLTAKLSARFENYEIVFVDDASRDGTQQEVRDFLEAMDEKPPVTMIHMSLKQGAEMAMNAGVDMAIGDFVYEFDTMQMPYEEKLILEAYDCCLLGNDIVTAAPVRNRSMASTLFYNLFNRYSGSKYKLQTDVFRLLSRRAINRVRSICNTPRYRKAAYATSGLKLETLTFEGKLGPGIGEMRFSKAVDSLALYTDIGYKASLGVALLMLGLTFLELVYTVSIFFSGMKPVPGWTTTMLVLTAGFFGVFLILAFALKYLSLLVDLVFKAQKYLIESVEKIT